MPLPKLTDLASESGYTAQPLATADYQDVGGGLPVVREDALDAMARVKVTWQLNTERYDFFLDFFMRVLDEGTLPFLVDLVYEYRNPQEYQAKFVPGSVNIVSVNLLSYTISAELEVVPASDPTADDTLLDLVDLYGSVELVEATLLMLEHLVDVVMPDTL